MSNKVMFGSSYVGGWTFDNSKPGFGTLHEAFTGALEVASRFNAKRAEIEANRLLTPEGKKVELRSYAAKHVMPALAKAAKATLPGARRNVEAKRDAMRLKGPDKTDVAGALLRQEIRAFFRDLPDSKRNAALLADDIDPLAAAALMEAPAPISGITEQQRERLIDRAMTAMHPEESAEIGQMGEAVEAVERAMRAAEKEVGGALGMTSRDWADFLDRSTAGDVEPPRLKLIDGVVKVIYRKEDGEYGFRARPATPEEIELGVYVDDAAA